MAVQIPDLREADLRMRAEIEAEMSVAAGVVQEQMCIRDRNMDEVGGSGRAMHNCEAGRYDQDQRYRDCGSGFI